MNVKRFLSSRSRRPRGDQILSGLRLSVEQRFEKLIRLQQFAEELRRAGAAAMTDFRALLLGAPSGLPFRWDERTIGNGLNFTLTTHLGALDLLGEITGGGDYDELLPGSIRLRLYGVECFCLGLERLIHVKRAAGRPKDWETIAELEAILEEQRRSG